MKICAKAIKLGPEDGTVLPPSGSPAYCEAEFELPHDTIAQLTSANTVVANNGEVLLLVTYGVPTDRDKIAWIK